MGQKKKRGKKNRKGNTQGNPDVDCVDQEVSGDRVLGAAKDVIKVDRFVFFFFFFFFRRKEKEKEKERDSQKDNIKRTFAAAGEWGTLSPSLSPHSLHVLNHVLGFKTMTPVQKSVIPLLLTHRDVAAEACTGFIFFFYFLIFFERGGRGVSKTLKRKRNNRVLIFF